MVIGNIKLEGYSPQIKASFPLTPYLLASGPGAVTTAAASAAPAPGGPGGPGGPGAAPPPPPDAGGGANDEQGN